MNFKTAESATARAKQSAADWDRAVALLLGPRLAGDSKDRRHSDALALAAAAMRAAGEKRE